MTVPGLVRDLEREAELLGAELLTLARKRDVEPEELATVARDYRRALLQARSTADAISSHAVQDGDANGEPR